MKQEMKAHGYELVVVHGRGLRKKRNKNFYNNANARFAVLF